MDCLEHLKAHLKDKVVILGIGNSLQSDDGIGSLLANRIKGKVPFIVYDGATCPENYLGKIIKDKPDNIVLIDAADFAGKPGELKVIEGDALETSNMFSTHNASLTLAVNYLKSHFKVDIILLAIQPKCISFGDKLSIELEAVLNKLENWFYAAKKEG